MNQRPQENKQSPDKLGTFAGVFTLCILTSPVPGGNRATNLKVKGDGTT
jgi:hypothetical protein